MPDPASPKTVMVVEDNPMNMRLASDLLRLHGFTVVPAENGEQALELLQTTTPHLILLDLHLPGMDGFEAFSRVRANAAWASIPIVALTASAMREEAEEIMAKGFNGHIAKPIDTKRFVEQVKAMVR